MCSVIVYIKDALMFAVLALKSVGESFGLIGKWGDLEKEWIRLFWVRCFRRSCGNGIDFELSGIINIIAIEIEVASGIAECI